MKKLLLFVLSVFSLNSFSQITYEKGYFINNDDTRLDCLIKNADWRNNPTKFSYKLTESSDPKQVSIESVKEFAIDNEAKYIRALVNIDRSSENVEHLDFERNPKFNEETLFLKQIIEGKANLYEYTDGTLKRFFYSKENHPIKQLIYKRYITDGNKIAENNGYSQQIWNDLICTTIQSKELEKLKYTKSDLSKIFIEYSNCKSEVASITEKIEKRDFFNLSIRPRIKSASLSIQNSSSEFRNTDFPSLIDFGFGVEGEFILPYNKNKWAIFIEPTYQSYQSEKNSSIMNTVGGQITAKVDYQSIDLPLGVRHFFFLNDESKLFLDGAFEVSLNQESKIEFFRANGSNLTQPLELKSNYNYAIGAGYRYEDRLTTQLRVRTNRDVLVNYYYWDSDYRTVSFIVGYSFF